MIDSYYVILSMGIMLAIIPARGGSKGIPRKNFAKINDKSLLEITINEAQRVEEIEEIYVSSEDLEILQVAKELGAYPHSRDLKFATDFSSANEVVKDFIEKQFEMTRLDNNTNLIYLQPTSPFRDSKHIKKALEIYNEKNNPVVSVRKLETTLQKIVLIKDGKISSIPDFEFSPTGNRQDQDDIYSPNGAIYIFKVSNFLENREIPIFGSTPMEMDWRTSLDIDTFEDLELARSIAQNGEF